MIQAPPGIRPTSARVREALFDIWAPRLHRARFLDLFAGSGAVGLEAVSRGARTVCLVENDRRALQTLRDNVELLGDEEVAVIALDLPAQLSARPTGLGGEFDLIFADPPYRFDAMSDLLERVGDLLASAGEVAVEHAVDSEVPEASGALTLFDQRRYGDSALSFYRPEPSSSG